MPMAVEDTDLERRVLAHERILQGLIRHLAEQDARILNDLRHTFGRGHALGQDEQDHISTKQYAEKFLDEIEQLIGTRHGAN